MNDVVAGALAQNDTVEGGNTGATGNDTVEGKIQFPDWMGQLPEDLKADPDLARYKTVPDLAKGLKETRAWARGRVAIPAGDDEAGWKEFGEKLRPADMAEYEIKLANEGGEDMAQAYRQFAYDNGLPPRFVKAQSEFYAQYLADQTSKAEQVAKDQVESIRLEFGEAAFTQRCVAVNNMMRNAGFGDDWDAVNALQSSTSADKAMRFLFSLAEKTGELGKVDPTDVQLGMGALTPEAAQVEADRLMNDAEFRKAYAKEGSPERTKMMALNEIIAKKR